jgi:hypothetical protein
VALVALANSGRQLERTLAGADPTVPHSTPLEVLNGTLMLFGGGSGSERAQVSALAGFRILLARVQAIFAALQLSNHGACFSVFNIFQQAISSIHNFVPGASARHKLMKAKT